MGTTLALILFAAAATAVIAFVNWRSRLDMTDLGHVSHQWLAEHRGNDRYYR